MDDALTIDDDELDVDLGEARRPVGVRIDGEPDEAVSLFEDAVSWLHEHYGDYEFWQERDVVWTVQTQLRRMIADRSLQYLVLHNYPMPLGTRRVSCDLVIRDPSKSVLVAAEFKYEPDHHRAEFQELPGKRPVAAWGREGVGDDVARVREFAQRGSARNAFAVFVDESNSFRYRNPHPGSVWLDWAGIGPGGGNVSVLWARFARS